MYMISASQIRAARGLLDWTQHDLAYAANVSRGTIKTIENGDPVRADKVRLIHKTLQDHGIEFLQGDGVKRQPDGFKDFMGPNSCDDFFSDVMETIEQKGGSLICFIESQNMLTRVTGTTRRTNLERLEQVHKLTDVKCLTTDKVKAPFSIPSFEIRTLPEEPSIMPMSVFVYDKKWVAGFQNNQMHMTFVIFQQLPSINNCQNYFASRWPIAKPLLLPMKPEKLCA